MRHTAGGIERVIGVHKHVQENKRQSTMAAQRLSKKVSIWHNKRLLDRFHGRGKHACEQLNTEKFQGLDPDEAISNDYEDSDADDDDVPLRPQWAIKKC